LSKTLATRGGMNTNNTQDRNAEANEDINKTSKI